MTFTNKAASEMAERVEKLVGGLSFAKPVISTFHSFCVRVLRRDIEALRIPSAVPGQPAIGHTKSFVIYDESDQQQLVKAAMRRLGIDDKQTTPRAVLAHISWAKNHMLDPQEVYLQSSDPKTERVAQIYEEYRKELRKANALDFDDLLLEAVRLLKAASRGARVLQPPLSVHHDRRISGHQPPAVRTDAPAGRNAPQRLRGRRRRSVHLFLARRRHPQHSGIRAGLSRGQNRPPGAELPLHAEHSAGRVGGGGEQRQTQGQESVDDRARAAPRSATTKRPTARTKPCSPPTTSRNICAKRAGEGETPRAAVLYRTNSQSRLFEEAMRRYQLKYHVVGGFSFYERAEIKDMISYLKVIQNPDDSISLLRVINTPVRGIGKATMEIIEQLALETGLSLWGAIGEAIRRQLLPQRALAAMRSFRDLIEDARAMLAGTYAERLEEERGAGAARPRAKPSG